jgi:hypothetical protein
MNIDVPPGETKIIGLSLGSATRVTELEQALDAQPSVRDRLLTVVRITERQSQKRGADVAACGGVAEPGEDRDDSHLARSPRTASCRANVDKIYDRNLRRNRRATDSVGRLAGSHERCKC